MIYFTKNISKAKKEALFKSVIAVPLTNKPINKPCLVLDNQNTLFFIYPSKNKPYNKTAVSAIGYYEYKEYGTYTENGEIDIFDDEKDKPIWHKLVIHPVLVISGIDIKHPENLSDIDIKCPENSENNNFKADNRIVYDALKAMGFIPDDTKNDLEKIFDVLISDEQQQHTKTAAYVTRLLQRHTYDYRNPEIFDVMFMYSLRTMLEQVADNLHKKPVIKDTYKANFIFLHYDFMESHIEKLIQIKTHTTCCIADKTRYIIKQFLNYAITGDDVVFQEPSTKNYHVPTFGTASEWITYCDSLYYLYHGKTMDYLKAFLTLIESEIIEFNKTSD